jgi:hypothetical protein
LAVLRSFPTTNNVSLASGNVLVGICGVRLSPILHASCHHNSAGWDGTDECEDLAQGSKEIQRLA